MADDTQRPERPDRDAPNTPVLPTVARKLAVVTLARAVR